MTVKNLKNKNKSYFQFNDAVEAEPYYHLVKLPNKKYAISYNEDALIGSNQ